MTQCAKLTAMVAVCSNNKPSYIHELLLLQESEDPEDEDAPVITTMRWRGAEIKPV